MKLVVILTCGMCGSWARIAVGAEPCPSSPGHVHVSASDERVRGWYHSHRAPDMTAVGHHLGGTA